MEIVGDVDAVRGIKFASAEWSGCRNRTIAENCGFLSDRVVFGHRTQSASVILRSKSCSSGRSCSREPPTCVKNREVSDRRFRHWSKVHHVNPTKHSEEKEAMDRERKVSRKLKTSSIGRIAIILATALRARPSPRTATAEDCRLQINAQSALTCSSLLSPQPLLHQILPTSRPPCEVVRGGEVGLARLLRGKRWAE